MIRKICCFIFASANLTFFAGCAPKIEPTQASNSNPVKSENKIDGWPKSYVDLFNKKVVLNKPAKRIVSLSPAMTETLYAIGADDLIVGVTSFCDYPENAKSKPQMGGFQPSTINLEKLLAAEPDLIITPSGIYKEMYDKLASLKLNVISVDVKKIEDVISNTWMLGQITNREENAEKLCTKLQKQLDEIKQKNDSLQPEKRLNALLLVAEEPLMAAGKESYPSQLLTYAGCRNIFSELADEYPRISDEEVLKRNPKVIIYLQMTQEDRIEKLKQRPGWHIVDAIKNSHVIGIKDNLLARGGPRLFEGLKILVDETSSIRDK